MCPFANLTVREGGRKGGRDGGRKEASEGERESESLWSVQEQP